MTQHLFHVTYRNYVEHNLGKHDKSVRGCPLCPQERFVRRDAIAGVLRDWIHETPLSKCGPGDDTCPDWELAYELADKINDQLEFSGHFAGIKE